MVRGWGDTRYQVDRVMKLKERLVMAALGFCLAVVMLVLLDSSLVIPHLEQGRSPHGRISMGRKER